MRQNDHDEYSEKELKDIKAEPWMVELLDLNPDYCSWGPHEDYMWVTNKGWASAAYLDSWSAFRSSFGLNDLNECVNFYFEVTRKNEGCTVCDNSGYNPETKRIADDFYGQDYSNGWRDKITQDEVDALIEKGRLGVVWNKETKSNDKEEPKPTAAEVNACNGRGSNLFSALKGRNGTYCHDAINRWILVEARAKRLGVWGHCVSCNGKGYVYVKPHAQVNLILWWLHPRKGCSKGIEIKNIQKKELPEVFSFLKEAADRNEERFSKVRQLAK